VGPSAAAETSRALLSLVHTALTVVPNCKRRGFFPDHVQSSLVHNQCDANAPMRSVHITSLRAHRTSSDLVSTVTSFHLSAVADATYHGALDSDEMRFTVETRSDEVR